MQTQILDVNENEANDIVDTDVPDEVQTLLEVEDLIDMKKFAEIFS